jgi:DNA-binding NtrC family response regulator
VEDHDIAVVVLDYDMGVFDPANLVKRLHHEFPRVFVIGHSGQNRQEEFAAIGVTEFMMKPWDVSDLTRIVDRRRQQFTEPN